MTQIQLDDDQRARESALDPRSSYIIQAPAGSGKTELLIQRFLRLLVTVEQCDQVLAVTFTKKASGEMRARICQALESALHDPEPDMKHARLTWSLARDVIEHGTQMGWPMQDLSKHLAIMTIDACCQHFLSMAESPYQLYAAYQLHPQPDLFYREVTANFIHRHCIAKKSRHYRDFHDLLLHQHHDYRQVEQLLVTALANREKWIRLTLTTRTADFVTDFSEAVGHVQETHCITLSSQFSDALCSQIEHILSGLCALNQSIGLASAIDDLADTSLRSWDIHQWRLFIQLLQTQSGQWRRRLNQQNGLANQTTLKALDSAQRDRYGALKSSLLELIATLQAQSELAMRLQETAYIPVVDDPEQEWASLAPLLSLLPSLVAFLHLSMDSAQTTDFSGINLQLSSALTDDHIGQSLVMRIYQRFRHVLIDEFQDTSIQQFEIFQRALSSWQGEPERSICVVGDPMQSIYRFRQAEVKLFYQAQREGFCGVHLENLYLQRNYRSGIDIVKTLNTIFSAVMTPHLNRFYPAQAVRDMANSGCFWHEVDAELSQAQVICQQVQQLQSTHPDLSKCILVRSRSQLRYLLPALTRNRIAYNGVGLHALGQCQAVLDVFSVACMLMDYFDRLSWVSFLNAPFVAMPMADIQILCRDRHAALWDSMQRPEQALSSDAQRILQRIVPPLQEALDGLAHQPLSDLTQRLWHQLGGDFTLASTIDYEQCLLFIDRIRELEMAAINITREHLQQLLSAYPETSQPTASNDLTIMTIHKSKGLEFDVVMIPYLEQSSPISEKRLLDWTHIAHQSAQHLLLHTHPRHRRQTTSVHRYLRYVDKQGQLAEMERLFYVGFTRAKAQLHLFSAQKSSYTERSIMRQLAPALCASLPEAQQIKHHHVSTHSSTLRHQSTTPMRAVLAADWLHPYADRWQTQRMDPAKRHHLQPLFTDEPIITRWGELIHLCMEYLLASERKPEITIAKIMQFAHALRIDLTTTSLGITHIHQALVRCTDDAQFIWLWQHRHSAVAEGSVLHASTVRRADYTLLVDRKRWIIDFKTHDMLTFLATGHVRTPTTIQHAYRDQLMAYQAAYQALDPDLEICCALYYPLTQSFLVLEHEPAPL